VRFFKAASVSNAGIISVIITILSIDHQIVIEPLPSKYRNTIVLNKGNGLMLKWGDFIFYCAEAEVMMSSSTIR
jgi:hypothetical protein